MPPDGDDPGAVTAIAVAAEDVIAAYEHNLDGRPRAVLRITPPFHGRMRARLHVEQAGEYDTSPEPIHLPPERLLDGERVPPRPGADDTAADLRTGEEYSVDAHHDRHQAAMAAWRDEVIDAIADAATLETPGGPREVRVAVLGAGR